MMKVLVVEGSRQERKQIVDALEQVASVAVQGAVSDVESARRVLASNTPDIVVTGMHLADGDGLDLIAAARRVPNAPAIIVVGEGAGREQWRRHLEAGADRFVDRDRGLQELRQVMGMVVAGREAGTDDPMRMLGRLTAGVAHDLSSYLAITNRIANLLRRDHNDPRLWEQLRGVTDRALRLTETLVSHVRGDLPEFEAIDLAETVRGTVDMAWSSIAGHIDVSIDIADRVPSICGVRTELEQLVLNLVLNAVDAMPNGGELRVTVAARPPAGVMLAISDTGAGFDLDAHAGLGLGIVRRVVDRHDAEVRVEREPPRTVVTLVFPDHTS